MTPRERYELDSVVPEENGLPQCLNELAEDFFEKLSDMGVEISHGLSMLSQMAATMVSFHIPPDHPQRMSAVGSFLTEMMAAMDSMDAEGDSVPEITTETETAGSA